MDVQKWYKGLGINRAAYEKKWVAAAFDAARQGGQS